VTPFRATIHKSPTDPMINAQTANRLDLLLADCRGEISYRRLPTRHARKGETWQRQSQHGRGAAIGNVRGGDFGSTGDTVAGAGKGVTLTRVCGIGKEMVRDLDSVVARAKAQYAADRRSAALERRGV